MSILGAWSLRILYYEVKNGLGFVNIKILGNTTEFPTITPEVVEEPQSGLHLLRYETVNEKEWLTRAVDAKYNGRGRKAVLDP